VFKTDHEGWSLITVISLNDLTDKPHNAYIKIFASKKREKKKAVISLNSMGLNDLPYRLKNLYQGLINIWYGKIKGDKMNIDMTPESVMKVGKIWGDAFLSTLTTDERLKLVKDIPVHERIKDIPISELEAIIKLMKMKKYA